MPATAPPTASPSRTPSVQPRLSLVPLGTEDAAALLAVSPPAVLREVRIRPWGDAEAARAWLLRRCGDGEHTLFGVHEAGRGLVGAGAVRRVDGLASLLYWIAPAHQGARRGSAAAALLLAAALDVGADEVWTCVLPGNERSLRILRRLEFRPAAWRQDGLLYLRRGPAPAAPDTVRAALARLTRRTPNRSLEG
jgi:RimJ/RimL family protein N-acetyltransferase